MSIVTLQIGQCGNQLGQDFFQSVYTEAEKNENSLSTFFRQPSNTNGEDTWIARGIMVDMEPKAVARCEAKAFSSSSGTKWKYDAKQKICKQSGSGNNWAYGYNIHGPQHFDAVGELIRKEIEECDQLDGFMIMQSVAGGTGSGLGTYITEQMADFFPSSYILNHVVWPYHSGEVIVQNYNALASMSCLSEVSDGIVVLQNDIANNICTRLLNITRPSFDHLNRVMANHLASTLIQNTIQSTRSFSPLGEIVQHLCSHPGYKLLDIRMIPQMPLNSIAFSSYSWSGLLKHLHQMHIADSALEEGIDWNIQLRANAAQDFQTTRIWNPMNYGVASSLYLRGFDALQADYHAFQDRRMYASWNPCPFKVYTSPFSFNHYEKCATLLSNSQAIVKPLEIMLDRAHEMMDNSAYLYQYERHGVEKEFFMDAFTRLEQVLENYKSLSYR